MGTTQRHQPWKFGDPSPTKSAAPLSAVLIAKGDAVGQAVAGGITGATSAGAITEGMPYPASDQPWDTDLATTQENFHDRFLGVSQSRSKSGETDPVVVNTRGVHEFDCASASFKNGALVGMAKQSGNLLEDKKVAAVASAALAIGRVYGDHTSVTKVLVEVFGTINHGGPQVPA